VHLLILLTLVGSAVEVVPSQSLQQNIAKSAEALLRGLNHALLTTTTKSLGDFFPSKKLLPGETLDNVDLPPIAERPLLVIVLTQSTKSVSSHQN
jgi:hypothetical protein